MEKKREEFKDIELGGRKWRIGRFDARTGSFIAFTLLTKMLPMGLEEGIKNLPVNRPFISKEEFISIQEDCLKICQEVKEGKNSKEAFLPVMLPDGRWGVADIETDIITVLGLTTHAILFNVSSFFAENAMQDLRRSFQDLSLPLFQKI